MTTTQTLVASNNSRPVAAAIALVVRQQKLLLVRRINPPDAGHWGFPGGKLGFGETIFEAAVRELKEETGVLAQPQRILTALDAFDHADGSLRAHYVLVAVLCRYESGEPLAADDAAEAGWFSWAQISSGAMPLSNDVESIAGPLLGGAT